MSTAIVVSPYERVVTDYFKEVEECLCKTDVEFFMRIKDVHGHMRRARRDIDILAYKPKEKKFSVCEVISYSPSERQHRAIIEKKIKAISSSDLKRFLKENYGIDKYEKRLVTWTKSDWVKELAESSNVKLLSFKEVFQSLIDCLKERRACANDSWIGVTSVTMLVLQTVLHFKKELKI